MLEAEFTPDVERRVNEGFRSWMGSSYFSSDDDDDEEDTRTLSRTSTNSSKGRETLFLANLRVYKKEHECKTRGGRRAFAEANTYFFIVGSFKPASSEACVRALLKNETFITRYTIARCYAKPMR
ncbi:LOW QUALITY PROTEIN: hypothetical protein M8C21_027736 [Ambrosia artemisiifolia]|uniref:Uncharacterized protein n=1 Tax=Ambrosia artemisiifolia TaxID=4212 RepID=A0AAD5D912_AMBAR|nr:LOW QUALITY PROTEIN: hypothetical protein M8C21_027736 [Ambrosia artemisiifolia]